MSEILIASRAYSSYQSPVLVEFNSISSPLPEMASKNSDVFVVLVSMNKVEFIAPVDDPLFSAHKLRKTLARNTLNETIDVYGRDSPMSAFGCWIQVSRHIFFPSCKLIFSSINSALHGMESQNFAPSWVVFLAQSQSWAILEQQKFRPPLLNSSSRSVELSTWK